MGLLMRAVAVLAALVLTGCASLPGSSGGAADGASAEDVPASGAITDRAHGEPAPTEDTLHIVVTTSILGELTERVAGPEAIVEVLMPVGADPHHFEASAREAASLREADVVIANGLNLEAGLEATLSSAEADGAAVVRIGPQVDPLPLAADAEGASPAEDGGGHTAHPEDGSALDPHFWLDPMRMAAAATVIGDVLDEVGRSGDGSTRGEGARAPKEPAGTRPAPTEPVGAAHARAVEAADDLERLAADLRQDLAPLAPESRTLVTNHHALGYFAERFQFTVIATVIPSGTTLAEPSSRQLAELTELITEEELPAIFAETTMPTRLSEALAAEVGRDVQVVELYTGSLGGPGSGAETYEDMMRLNVDRIVEALS